MDDGSFNRLLDWLGTDPEQAGKKYEEIRRKLIRILASRGCPMAEELADLTIDRVKNKIEEVSPGYEGDPAAFFVAVANKIFLEWRRRMAVTRVSPPLPRSTEEKEREDQCLSQCMATLPDPDQNLLLEYYREEKQAKIDRRKALAAERGVTDNALKVKVFRLRCSLRDCLLQCLEDTEKM